MQRLYSQLPEFARPTHPVMRYTLLNEGRRARPSTRLLRGLGSLLVLVVLLLLGYEIATGFGTAPLDETLNPLGKVFLVLYWPLVILQIGIRLVAIGSTTGIVNTESLRGTWDTLKITTDGAGLTMRTRWAAVFYRLRFVLILLVAARVFFIIVALLDFASFQGRYLDLMVTGTVPLGQPEMNPVVGLALGVVVASMMMTAALVMPFTAIAFDASIGMLIGVSIRGRWMGILGQGVVLLLRIAVSTAALYLGTLALSFTPPGLSTVPGALFAPTSNLGSWFGALFGVAEGDLGLTMLHLPYYPRFWADIEYGVLIGVAALIYVLVQAGLAQLIVRLAVRWAARADKT